MNKIMTQNQRKLAARLTGRQDGTARMNLANLFDPAPSETSGVPKSPFTGADGAKGGNVVGLPLRSRWPQAA